MILITFTSLIFHDSPFILFQVNLSLSMWGNKIVLTKVTFLSIGILMPIQKIVFIIFLLITYMTTWSTVSSSASCEDFLQLALQVVNNKIRHIMLNKHLTRFQILLEETTLYGKLTICSPRCIGRKLTRLSFVSYNL